MKATAPTLSGSLKQSTLNVAYSSGLNVKGTEPITWSISGALPDGLTFDTSTGIISGTPKEYGKNGSFRIKITASNPVGSRSKSITFRVKGTRPTIKAKFPNATAGEYYSVNLTATGSDPITWTADLPEYLTLDGDTIAGTIPDSVPGNRIKIKVYASNPVKTVNNTYTIKVITNKKAIPENLNDDNDTGSTENESDNETPTDNNAGEVQGVTGGTGDTPQVNQKSGIPEGYIVVAELGEISRDVAGMYDFEVELPDSVSIGSELIYIANSARPSDDDEIAEFFDDTGKEITTVPESRKITLSVWLNKGVVYSPALAVKK